MVTFHDDYRTIYGPDYEFVTAEEILSFQADEHK
jgi:hypothetical protein